MDEVMEAERHTAVQYGLGSPPSRHIDSTTRSAVEIVVFVGIRVALAPTRSDPFGADKADRIRREIAVRRSPDEPAAR